MSHKKDNCIEKGKLVVYIDDIIIALVGFYEHLDIIKKVLDTLRKNGLELRLDKFKFAHEELDYLGYRANAAGIRPSDHHIKAITKYPQPQNKKQLQQCLGLFSFFRRFVPSFSILAKPLTNLLKDKVTFVFDNQCVTAFETLKKKLVEAPLLSVCDP